MSTRNNIVCSLCLNYAEEMLLKKQKSAVSSPSTCTPVPSSNLIQDDTPTVNPPCEPIPSTSRRPTGKSSGENTSDDDISEVPKFCPGVVDDIVARIKSGLVVQQDLRKLAHAIGCSLSGEIFQDSKVLHLVYSNLETLHSLKCKDFLNMRPAPLIDFILGAASVSIDNPHDESKLLGLCTAVEGIYKARNGMFVGPLAFGNGVIKWSMCGSKTAHSLDGASGAGGSINTLRTFFKSSSTEPNECYTGDIDIFSDNTQRTGKTVRVGEDGTTPVGVATNVVFIQSNPPTDLQSRKDLKPSEWSNNERPNSETTDDITKLETHLNEDYFRPYRIEFQAGLLKEVKEEIKFEGSQTTDHVDLVESAPKDSSVCTKCSAIFPKHMSICPKCSNKRHNISDRIVLYGDVPSVHPDAKPSVKMGEIIGVNPNSKDTLTCVLDNLSKQCGIGEGRAWVRLGFDGVPYRIVDNIIKETVVCEVCGEEVDIGKTPFPMHVDENHPGG
jgi:ribosomal protein L40E